MASAVDQMLGREDPAAYRQQLSDEVQRDGYGEDQHRNTQRSFRSQRRLNTDTNFALRDFADNTLWENPGGIPSDVDQNNGYLTHMARSQARAIVAIQDGMAKSNLGRAMVDMAHRGHVQFSFGKLPEADTVAGYLYRQRQTVFNLDGDLVNQQDSQQFINNAMVDTAHELGHMGQAQANGSTFAVLDYTLRHEDRLLALGHYEAAATAASVQVAWELGEAGNLGPWQAISENGPDMGSARAFAELASRDPKAVTDGRARRAAHDAWYDLTDRKVAYADAVTMAYRDVLTSLAMQQGVDYPHPNARPLITAMGHATIADDQLSLAGAMPDGMNHLSLPGGRDLHDPVYRDLGNPRLIEQVAFLDRMAAKFQAGERVTPVMLNGYDAIKAKYDGTPHAQDPEVTAFGDGIPGDPDHPLDRVNVLPSAQGADGALGKWRQLRHQVPTSPPDTALGSQSGLQADQQPVTTPSLRSLKRG